MSRIGIFVKSSDSIFTNGCVQQGYFVLKSLRKAGYECDFVTVESHFTKFELLDEKIHNVLHYDELKKYKLFIFSSLNINQIEFLAYIRMLGIKVVNQMVGNYHILNNEEFVFNVHEGVLKGMINEYIDEVWLMPMYSHTKEYIEAITRKPVKICPYVWDNEFIKKYMSSQSFNAYYNKHIPKDKPLEVIILEPNLSVHKTALLPLLILNQFFLRHPDKLSHIHLISKPPRNENFLETIKDLEIVKCNKITSYPRMISLEVYKQMNSKNVKYIVLSSNIRNNLNFLHLECFTLGIPIIHNCQPFSDSGLYYDDNDDFIDVEKAIDLLLKLHENPYKYQNTENIVDILIKYNPNNKINYNEYKELVENLLATKKYSLTDMKDILENNNDLTIKEDEELGLVSYLNKKSYLSVFKRNIYYLKKNNSILPMTIFYNEDEVNIDEYRNNTDGYSINFVNKIDISLNDRHSYLYALANSPYQKTIFFNNNNVLLFDCIELSKKFTANSYIEINHNSLIKNIDIEDKNKYYKEFLKLLNIKIENESIPIIDTNLIMYSSSTFKRLIQMVYNNIEKVTAIIDLDYIVKFVLILSGCNCISIIPNSLIVSNIDNGNIQVIGLVNILNDIPMNITYDKELIINSAIDIENYKQYNINNYLSRTFSIQKVIPFKLDL